MKTQAKQMCEEMAKAAHCPKKSKEVDAKFKYKVVRFKAHGDKRGLRFEDGSKLFLGESSFILPADDMSTVELTTVEYKIKGDRE